VRGELDGNRTRNAKKITALFNCQKKTSKRGGEALMKKRKGTTGWGSKKKMLRRFKAEASKSAASAIDHLDERKGKI